MEPVQIVWMSITILKVFVRDVILLVQLVLMETNVSVVKLVLSNMEVNAWQFVQMAMNKNQVNVLHVLVIVSSVQEQPVSNVLLTTFSIVLYVELIVLMVITNYYRNVNLVKQDVLFVPVIHHVLNVHLGITCMEVHVWILVLKLCLETIKYVNIVQQIV